MAVRLNYAADVTGLHQSIESTLEQIDCALDRGDRKAFRVWCNRYSSLTARLDTMLLRIATTKET